MDYTRAIPTVDAQGPAISAAAKTGKPTNIMQQNRGIYLISVVAETLDMHPQTLRKYERAGFVAPLRMGALRTYSDEDVARLQAHQALRGRHGPEPGGGAVGANDDVGAAGAAPGKRSYREAAPRSALTGCWPLWACGWCAAASRNRRRKNQAKAGSRSTKERRWSSTRGRVRDVCEPRLP